MPLKSREKTLMNESKFKGTIKKSPKYKKHHRDKEKVRFTDGKRNTKEGLVLLQKKAEEEGAAPPAAGQGTPSSGDAM